MNLLILLLLAQEPNGSITGTVRDAATGQSLSRVEVTSGKFSATTDTHGTYTLSGIPAGTRIINAGNISPVTKYHATRTVTLAAGEKLESIDLTVTRKASITGKVVDEDGEPLPRTEVVVFAREYVGGQPRFFRKSNAHTNDLGVYDLPFLNPGIAYLLMAKPIGTFKNTINQKFIEPKLRTPVLVPTYYPSSTSPEGNPLITLAPDDRRENIDFRMVRSKSFCATGQLTAAGQPAQLTYLLEETDWSGGIGPGGGRTSIPHGDKSTADGKVRICGLRRGDYMLTTFDGDFNKQTLFGSTTLTILDRDLPNFTLNAAPPVSVPGEVRWADTPPEHPPTAEVTLLLQSNTRSFNLFGHASSEIPGKFTLDNVVAGEYRLEPRIPNNLYVKEITYGATSLLRSSLVVSQPSQQAIHVLISRDGAHLNARVQDREGKRIPDATVIVVPADVTTEAELVARRIIGRTDQTGTYKSPALAPARYYLLATTATTPNLTVEGIAAIWRARFKGQDVSLKAGSTLDISLEPMPLN